MKCHAQHTDNRLLQIEAYTEQTYICYANTLVLFLKILLQFSRLWPEPSMNLAVFSKQAQEKPHKYKNSIKKGI